MTLGKKGMDQHQFGAAHRTRHRTDDTVYVGDTDGNSITILKNGKVVDVIGFLQARPHNIAIDPATGVLYLADPPTPMMAGGIFNAAPRNAAPARNTGAGSVDRTAERMQGGLVKQVIRKGER